MAQTQPPFAALRALEAAARHRSFTRAARELRVTHSAVSQAVRRLESDMGTRLFDRRGGAMEPSDAALKLAQTYSAAAEQLTGLIREIRGDEAVRPLTLRLPPTARAWMAGREGRLAEALPDLEIALADDDGPSAADVELLAAQRARPGDQAVAPLVLAPAAAPTLFEGDPDPAAIADLPLLGERSDDWAAWLARYRPGARRRARVIRDRGALVDAAVAGEGVMLADQLAAYPRLAAGDLRQAAFPVEKGQQILLRSRVAPAQAEAIERLAMWLKLELARDGALLRKGGARR